MDQGEKIPDTRPFHRNASAETPTDACGVKASFCVQAESPLLGLDPPEVGGDVEPLTNRRIEALYTTKGLWDRLRRYKYCVFDGPKDSQSVIHVLCGKYQVEMEAGVVQNLQTRCRIVICML